MNEEMPTPSARSPSPAGYRPGMAAPAPHSEPGNRHHGSDLKPTTVVHAESAIRNTRSERGGDLA